MSGMLRSLLTMKDRFFWSSALVTRSGPHIRDANNVQRLWNYFVIASLPAWLIGNQSRHRRFSAGKCAGLARLAAERGRNRI